MGRFLQGGHEEGVGCRRSVLRHQIHVGGVAGQRYTDEVDQVIAGKRQGQCEGTHQDDHLEYIHLQPVEYLHQDGESDQAAADDHTRIVVNLGFQFRIHEGTVL